MSLERVNINSQVLVKLTVQGHKVLIKAGITNKLEVAGYISFQLWELMQLFGPHFVVSLSCQLFENNDLYLIKKEDR